MAASSFRALVVTVNEKDQVNRQIQQREIDDLSPGEVLIRVAYSSLNYKDALSASGHRGVTRNYPHTPGIDAAGVVESCTCNDFQTGEAVLVTGYDLGMDTDGGFGEFIRVPADWVVRLPQGLSLRESMLLGTAGFTAGLSINKFVQNNISPDAGEILVTGATGGVGSLAVAMLAKLGYRVVAATGKMDQASFLTQLGATRVISRDEVDDTSGRPLLKGRWVGVVDTVGGNILSTAIRSTQLEGTVTTCGNVASVKLETTVFPFIIRGVSLLGINSATCPGPRRLKIWHRLATDWKPACLADISRECSLEQLEPEIERILRGEQVGRVLVKLGA